MKRETNLNVLKFGGTSMADAKAMVRAAHISLKHQAHIVVVSATSNTTNQLLEIARLGEKGERDNALDIVKKIELRHLTIAHELNFCEKEFQMLHELIQELDELARGISLMREASARAFDRIAALGERLSSVLFWKALDTSIKQSRAKGKSCLVDARKLIRTDSRYMSARPQPEIIQSMCREYLTQLGDGDTIYVTQGFIGSNEQGHTTTLGRGGSDYSAALLAEGVGASVLEIWTDVAGIATTDPRLCPKAEMIPEITFKEAAELAIFGAKVLHPTTLAPAMRAKIAVFVGSSYQPESCGTWIRWHTDSLPLVRAVTLRKNQGLITLSSSTMLNQYGFLYEIFKIFKDFQVSIDAITTSEISVALTVDSSVLENKLLLAHLSELCEVKVEENLTLVSLIGNNINHTAGLAKNIFSALEDINIRMICQGASVHNFCFLVEGTKGEEALRRLHCAFLE